MIEQEQAEIEAELTERENARSHALVNDDMEALADLLDDDLVHVHATGNVQNKTQVLNHAGSFLRFRAAERGPLKIRQLAPDVAVMTGAATNTVERRGTDDVRVTRAYVTQVWTRRDGRWRIVNFHSVRLPEA